MARLLGYIQSELHLEAEQYRLLIYIQAAWLHTE
jgi:hypothetical protein